MLALKTYKPWKPEYKEIDNVHELCRLCLEKTQDGVKIFKDSQDMCAALAMRIMICVGLDIKDEQTLPNMICKTCSEDLERYYKFRKKCQASYQKLKHHILALKSKHAQEYVEIEVPVENITVSDETCRPDDVQKDGKSANKQLFSLPEEKPATVTEKIAEEALEMKEVQIPIQSEMNPDISIFLSTVLTELGFLSEERGLLHHRGVSTFELETGDQEQFVLELVEEDEETPVIIKQDQTEQDAEEPDDMIIDSKPQFAIMKPDKNVYSALQLNKRSDRSDDLILYVVRGLMTKLRNQARSKVFTTLL